MSNYRPISLCNTVYKFFFRIMVNRIKPLLEKIIFGNQKRFVAGIKFLDVVIISHEIVHSMAHSKIPTMALKLDISKAYDRVSYDFIFFVLEKFSFKGRFIILIKECVSTTRFVVLLNGVPTKRFTYGKGFRQGDPLSPYLFIIIAKVLGQNLQKCLDRGYLHRV